MANKYLIVNNELIFGDVAYHSDLLKNINPKPSDILGGGSWNFNDGILCFFSASTDYGAVTKEQILTALKKSPTAFPNAEIYYSRKVTLKEVLEEYMLIKSSPFTQEQIDNRTSDWICFECGGDFLSKAQKSERGHAAVTAHTSVCGLCGKNTTVIHARNWNWLNFKR